MVVVKPVNYKSRASRSWILATVDPPQILRHPEQIHNGFAFRGNQRNSATDIKSPHITQNVQTRKVSIPF
jgi:hypothetical protein